MIEAFAFINSLPSFSLGHSLLTRRILYFNPLPFFSPSYFTSNAILTDLKVSTYKNLPRLVPLSCSFLRYLAATPEFH